MKYKIILYRESGYVNGEKTMTIETDEFYQERLDELIEHGLAEKIEVFSREGYFTLPI